MGSDQQKGADAGAGRETADLISNLEKAVSAVFIGSPEAVALAVLALVAIKLSSVK